MKSTVGRPLFEIDCAGPTEEAAKGRLANWLTWRHRTFQGIDSAAERRAHCRTGRSPTARSAALIWTNLPRTIFDGSHWQRSRRPAHISDEVQARRHGVTTWPRFPAEAEERIKVTDMAWTLDTASPSASNSRSPDFPRRLPS